MCRPILRAIAVPVATLSALIFALPLQADPPGWTITRLTDNEFDDYYPDVSGSNVVWCGNDGDDYDSAGVNSDHHDDLNNNDNHNDGARFGTRGDMSRCMGCFAGRR